MALYWRGSLNPGDVKYHTTLLLIPKGADPDSKNNNSIRYHVNNTFDNEREIWEFEPLRTRPKTYQLRALVFLGKLDITESQLEEILKSVQIIQNNPAWRCRHWVWSAMELLSQMGVIAPLPGPAETVWNTAVAFLENRDSIHPIGVIPTCTTTGEDTKSALDGA